MVLIDSNVLLDIWQNDPQWSPLSTAALKRLAATEELAINPIIFAEVSVRFASRSQVEMAIDNLTIALLNIPNETAFLAGKAFQQYRKQSGLKTGVLPDFLIGAHAAVLGMSLLTRDTRRYATYFPTVRLITP